MTLIIPISEAGIDRVAKSEDRAVQVNRDTDEDAQEKEEEECDYWRAVKWKEEWFRVSRPVPHRGMKECYLGVLVVEITISMDRQRGRCWREDTEFDCHAEQVEMRDGGKPSQQVCEGECVGGRDK